MSEEDDKHWKEYFEHDYLGSWGFKDDVAQVKTISHLKTEEIFNPKTNKIQNKAVLHFSDDKLSMVLNTTNALTIEGLFGIHPAKWKGRRIAIYKTTTEKKVDKEYRDCLRIINKEPPAEPKEIDIKEWRKTRMRRG